MKKLKDGESPYDPDKHAYTSLEWETLTEEEKEKVRESRALYKKKMKLGKKRKIAAITEQSNSDGSSSDEPDEGMGDTMTRRPGK